MHKPFVCIFCCLCSILLFCTYLNYCIKEDTMEQIHLTINNSEMHINTHFKFNHLFTFHFVKTEIQFHQVKFDEIWRFSG